MDHSSDDDFDFSDDEIENGVSQNLTEPVKRPDSKKVVAGVKHLLELKETLSLDSFKEKKSNKKERKRRQKERKRLQKKGLAAQLGKPVVQTLATELGGKEYAPPEVVVFEDARKKSRKRKELEAAKILASHANLVPQNKVTLDSDDIELSMKQARFEVFKFSLSGMDKANQMDARVAQAIRLGAKAPKNSCLPINELKEKRKVEREEARIQKEMQRVSGMMTSSRPTKGTSVGSKAKGVDKKKRDPKPSSSKSSKKGGQSIALKMGRFDGGMLKLSAKDLASIKK